MKYAQKERFRNLGYSETYITIRDTIEKTWPRWKIDFYNAYMATAAHSMKLCPDNLATGLINSPQCLSQL